ncbi:hypothetical protein B0H11DRAFT_2205658 [Mycena galericulata]|nr:hypothetical protein B0H11DRAFT_2205658 [Mycena galericulata]
MSNHRYYNTLGARTPAADQSGVFFQTGQGGRTLLPPLSSAFPTSHFTVPHHSSQHSQPLPNRFDYNQQSESYNNQWQANNTPMTVPQLAFPHYDDPPDPSTLLDLTRQVRREANSYPRAFGGFADVWKGRLAHEMSVWTRLAHKHVLELLGTVSDFGPYDSSGAACRNTWSAAGTFCLQLSNILIDDDGKARLGDTVIRYLMYCAYTFTSTFGLIRVKYDRHPCKVLSLARIAVGWDGMGG